MTPMTQTKAPDPAQVAQVKDKALATWSTGDFAAVAPHVESAAEVTVDALEIAPGDRLLDIATGSGNAALVAARRGARVTGLDFVASLLDVARERAAAAGVEIDLVEGDAEALPFADASFDHVTSVFGIQFAPRHAVAAGELLRVCRPGGTFALASWTPDGAIGEMFSVIGRYVPAPPEFVSPPPLWGSEEHVAELLGDGAELTFKRLVCPFRFESLDAYMEHFERHYGPTIKTQQALEASGDWSRCRAELRDLYASHDSADGDGFELRAEYLLAVGRRHDG